MRFPVTVEHDVERGRIVFDEMELCRKPRGVCLSPASDSVLARTVYTDSSRPRPEGLARYEQRKCDFREVQLLFLTLWYRKYPLERVAEIKETKVMGIVAQEARDSKEPKIVVELRNESVEGLESSVAWVVKRIYA